MRSMLQSSNFRYLEKILYDRKTYDTAIAEHEAQLEEIMPDFSSSVVKFNPDHHIESQTENWAIKRIESVKAKYHLGRIAEMKRHKEAISQAMAVLDETESRFVLMRYELEKPHSHIAKKLFMWDKPERKPLRAYWNMRERILKKIARFLGLE